MSPGPTDWEKVEFFHRIEAVILGGKPAPPLEEIIEKYGPPDYEDNHDGMVWELHPEVWDGLVCYKDGEWRVYCDQGGAL